MFHTPDAVRDPLYVITPIFNPARYKSRWKHYHRFAKYVRDSGAILVTIEAAFAEREHAIETRYEDADPALTRCDGARHQYIRVRTPHELWIKENLINLAMQRLPASWKYVAWVDADVAFARPNWVGETIHALQHYHFVQMFSQAVDLGPGYETSRHQRCSFLGGYESGALAAASAYEYPAGFATGLAWAARREAIDAVGGLMDFCILGSADWHMAYALVGRGEDSYPADLSNEYKQRIAEWQFRADRYIRRNVGAISGLLMHYWHGRKIDRQYAERWKVLVEHQYRPSTDLKPDWQGVHQVCDHGDARSENLRDGIRRYFRERNEDSIDE